MKNLFKIALLGLAHGLSDCVAGFMIGSLPHEEGWLGAGALVLLYNALAFGGQVPAGILVDRIKQPRWIVFGSLGLVLVAIAVFEANPLLAITFAGIGGAFFHVSGGMLALMAYPKSTIGTGLFAAPGVMGLALGGYLAWSAFPLMPWLIGGIALVTLLVGVLDMNFEAPKPKQKAEPLGWHDFMMLALLLAIAMRSAVWNLFQLIHLEAHWLLVLAGLAAMTGKVLGAIIADKVGWRRYAVFALGIATPLLAFGGIEPPFFLPGIMLLQSATPVAVLGMYRLMPKMPATAVGMCFGLAIAIGGIPMMFDLDWPMLWFVVALLPLAAAGYYFGLRGKNKSTA